MRLSICYLTGRREPHVEWLLAAVQRQRQRGDKIELLIVDALGRGVNELVSDARGVDRVRVVPPKPNLWQGPHRLTPRDVWAKSQSANTAICLARYDYLAFVDDRCVPGPRWLAAIRKGSSRRASVLAGAYERILGVDQREVDHRLSRRPEGKTDCGGGWLYGCTFALPLAWALEVNGFEEGLDGLAQEDCVFGFYLENAGHRIDFVPALHVTLHRQHAEAQHPYARSDGAEFKEALARFRDRRCAEFTPDLRDLRKRVRAGKEFPSVREPTHPWLRRRLALARGSGT